MRFFLTYVLLVGLPLLALLGVLNAGARLHAPPAVGGDWVLDASPVASASPPLRVVQSGQLLELRWGAARGRGHLVEGERLAGTLVEGATAWTLEARRAPGPRLEGSLTRSDGRRVDFSARAQADGEGR